MVKSSKSNEIITKYYKNDLIHLASAKNGIITFLNESPQNVCDIYGNQLTNPSNFSLICNSSFVNYTISINDNIVWPTNLVLNIEKYQSINDFIQNDNIIQNFVQWDWITQNVGSTFYPVYWTAYLNIEIISGQLATTSTAYPYTTTYYNPGDIISSYIHRNGSYPSYTYSMDSLQITQPAVIKISLRNN